MRLIHTKTLKLAEFAGKVIPPYVILSHTWEEGEVSFQDMQGGDANQKAGHDKIKRCCEVAAAQGFEHAWIDTCCIDKTSSSELSEAINSMYRWYQAAEVCYAYLSDVPPQEGASGSAFANSRWFTRGWTLQELIAPASLIFFGSNWQEIGTKSSLQGVISRITGIHAEALLCADDCLQNFSVAQRMSWASVRQTTRIEDLAYCLMGIFGVNMPMLYGEGERSFIRLQEEIMKSSDDPTIFAWRKMASNGGLLATSPAVFHRSGRIIRSKDHNNISFTWTNRGLHLQISSKYLSSSSGEKEVLAVLDCHEIGKSEQLLGIYLLEVPGSTEYRFRSRRNQMGNIATSEVTTLERESFYVKGDLGQEMEIPRYLSWLVVTSGLEKLGISPRDVFPPKWLQPDGQIYGFASGLFSTFNTIGAVRFASTDTESWAVVLKIFWGNLSVNVVSALPNERSKEISQSFETMATTATHKRTWRNEPDRIVWQLPDKKEWIHIAIRRQIWSGKRTFVVDISYIDLDS